MHAVMIIHNDGKEYVAAVCQDVYMAHFIADAANKNNEMMQNPVKYEVRDLERH